MKWISRHADWSRSAKMVLQERAPVRAEACYNPLVTFEVSVKLLIERPGGEVLLLKRESSRGDLFWDLPGGRLNQVEVFQKTLARELDEEIGYQGEIGEITLLDARTWDDPTWDGPPKVLIYYKAYLSPSHITLSGEHHGHKWITSVEKAGEEARLEEDLVEILEKGFQHSKMQETLTQLAECLADASSLTYEEALAALAGDVRVREEALSMIVQELRYSQDMRQMSDARAKLLSLSR